MSRYTYFHHHRITYYLLHCPCLDGWGWERGGVLRTILQGFIFRVFSMGGGVYVTGFHFFITRKNLPERERRDEAMI
jgi:hypothetical protein